jgi:predicted porin
MKGIRVAAVSAAVILLGGAGSAFAADLPVKAPVYKAPADDTCTSIMDFFTTACQVAAYGVRFYGTIDVGFGYQTNGAPIDKYLGTNYFLGKPSLGSRWTLAPNALSASNVGFQIKESLGSGWSFVGQVETGFQPFSLQPLNGVHSQANMIGVPISQQTAMGDSNSQGTFYNDLGFAGFSHDTWGTLTFGRQNNLLQDASLAYDPMGVAAGFSPLGFFGTYAGGGDTENRRDTTAIKYRVNYANWHFGAYAQVGGYDEGNASNGAYFGDLGADYHVGPGLFSADVVGGYRRDAVSLGSQLVGQTDQFGYPINTNIGFNTATNTYTEFMQATISNNTSMMALAKYTVDKLTLYAGYEWIQFENPSDPQSAFTDIAGDFVCANCYKPGGLVLNGTNINNTAYTVPEIRQLAWFGGKYALTDSLTVTAAYYHVWQNDYSGGAANKPANGATGLTCSQVSTANSSCAGTIDGVSALLDWKFAAKWDTYIGTLYSRNTGGLDNGYLAKDNWATTAGLRFRW